VFSDGWRFYAATLSKSRCLRIGFFHADATFSVASLTLKAP
jgi:hypothetical protein